MGVVERRAEPHPRRRAPARLAQRVDVRRAAARVAVRLPDDRPGGPGRRGARGAPQPLPGRRPHRRAEPRAARGRRRRRPDRCRRPRSAFRGGRRPPLRTAVPRPADRVAGLRNPHRGRRRCRGRDARRHVGSGARPGRGRRDPLCRDRVRDGPGRSRSHPRRPRRRAAGRRCRDRGPADRWPPGVARAAPRAGVRRRGGARRGGTDRATRLAVRRHVAVDPDRHRRPAGVRADAHLAAGVAARQRAGARRGRRRAPHGSFCKLLGACSEHAPSILRGRRSGRGVSRGRRGAAADARSRAGRSRRRRPDRRRGARRHRFPGGDLRAAGRRR